MNPLVMQLAGKPQCFRKPYFSITNTEQRKVKKKKLQIISIITMRFEMYDRPTKCVCGLLLLCETSNT